MHWPAGEAGKGRARRAGPHRIPVPGTGKLNVHVIENRHEIEIALLGSGRDTACYKKRATA